MFYVVAFFHIVFCVALVGSVLTAAVLSVFVDPLLAVALGLASGVVLGLGTALLVLVWPVLRVLWWWSIEITAAVFGIAVHDHLIVGNGRQTSLRREGLL